MKIKKGPTVFSAMRPLHKALEFSSSVFIPGVTGNFNGALEMLREIAKMIGDGVVKDMVLMQEDVLSFNSVSGNSIQEKIQNIIIEGLKTSYSA